MAKGKARAAIRRRRSRKARDPKWWRQPVTIALLAWISTVGTCGPQIVASVTWLRNQRQNYAGNLVLEHVSAGARRHKALADGDLAQAQLDRAVEDSIAKDEAILAALRDPKK